MSPAQPQIVVQSAADLWQALRRRGAISLHLSFIDSRAQASAEKRFNFWRQVCGCQLGALLLIAVLIWRIPALLHRPAWTWGALAVEAGIALLSAIGGKVLAIVGARLVLVADIAMLLRRFRHAAPGTVEG